MYDFKIDTEVGEIHLEIKDYKLSSNMIEALKLMLEQGEFYYRDLDTWAFWVGYGSNKHIRTDTMKALEKRGLVCIGWKPSYLSELTKEGRNLANMFSK